MRLQIWSTIIPIRVYSVLQFCQDQEMEAVYLVLQHHQELLQEMKVDYLEIQLEEVDYLEILLEQVDYLVRQQNQNHQLEVDYLDPLLNLFLKLTHPTLEV